MKTRRMRMTLLTGAWLAASGAAAFAQYPDQGFYVSGNVGVAIAENVAITEALGPVSGVKTDFDPGAHFSVAGGYRLTRWLALEAESGATVNYFADGDASLTHVPLFANLVLRGSSRQVFQPFIGGGAGVDFAVLELDRVSIAGSPILDGTESDAVFAYHAFAGFTVALNERMSIGARSEEHTSELQSLAYLVC